MVRNNQLISVCLDTTKNVVDTTKSLKIREFSEASTSSFKGIVVLESKLIHCTAIPNIPLVFHSEGKATNSRFYLFSLGKIDSCVLSKHTISVVLHLRLGFTLIC